MNRSIAAINDDSVKIIADRMVWAKPVAPGIALAAATDHDELAEAEIEDCLPASEREAAARLVGPLERRHFKFRRCFQRVFLCKVLQFSGQPRDLRIEHGRDTQPRCHDAMDHHLSFSSSGSTALACASSKHLIGVDVEKIRHIGNAADLARRFFTTREANAIASAPSVERSLIFLKHWTAKEAGLKATGLGIISGLNRVVLRNTSSRYEAEFIGQSEKNRDWTLNYPEFLPGHVVAIMHRPADKFRPAL